MQVAVVGAGILGRLLALGLHQQGWQVTVFDAQNNWLKPANCSQVAAGLLAPISELDRSDKVVFQLGLASLQYLWPKLLDQLAVPIYFRANGSVIVHHPQDVAQWQTFLGRISSKIGNNFYTPLQQQELQQLEPELANFQNAYYIADEGHLDSQAVLHALGLYLNSLGIQCHSHTEVDAVLPGKVICKQQAFHFDLVCDCRGMGAKPLIPKLRAVRGELLWLHAPEVHIEHSVRLLHPRYSLYLVPRPQQHYLIGASELEAEDYSPVSVRSALELLSAAYYLHAGFAEARIIKTLTHCRPSLPDNQPRIYFTDQLLIVNGLYRHGYLIAPALVEEILNGINTSRRTIQYPNLWEAYRHEHLFEQSTHSCAPAV